MTTVDDVINEHPMGTATGRAPFHCPTTKGGAHIVCPNNHDPDRIEVRPDGSRVCGACRDLYGARRRRVGKDLKTTNHRLGGATNHAQQRS